MKKILFSVAILAVAASCSKNEVVDLPQTNEIGFVTLNNRVTKAANDISSDYKVYAYVKASATAAYSTSPYISETIVGTTDVFETAANHYYWPTATGSAVNFYAAAPVTGVTAGTANEHLFAYTVPAAADVDFTVAATVKGATCTPDALNPGTATFTPDSGDSYVDSDGKVQLKFYHMLSKAMINVKLADELNPKYEFTFTKATFNVDLNQVSVSTYDVTNGEPAAKTATTAASAAYDYSTYKDASDAAATMGTTYDISFSGDQDLFFAAQDGDGCSIDLTGVIVKDTATDQEIFNGDLTYELTSSEVFAYGKSYLFTITIDKSKTNLFEILFASDLANWETATPGVDIQ